MLILNSMGILMNSHRFFTKISQKNNQLRNKMIMEPQKALMKERKENNLNKYVQILGIKLLKES